MPPPAVPGCSVQNSRMRLSSPMTSSLSSPRYFRSCGTAPTDANWKIWLRAPIVVRPSMTHVRADHRAAADAHARADDRVGADRHVGGELRLRRHERGGMDARRAHRLLRSYFVFFALYRAMTCWVRSSSGAPYSTLLLDCSRMIL